MEILIANESHFKYAKIISDTITESASVRGTGIAQRTPEYIIKRLEHGNAVIALDGDKFAGFCYIEVWGTQKVCCKFRSYSSSGLQKSRPGKKN